MEDEIDMLKSVNVSGSDDWDCFITIVHFQQCGKCSPNARKYTQNALLPYVWDIRNLSIRPCKQACGYIYKQCSGAMTLAGQPVVPNGISVEAFCQDAPDAPTDAVWCYNGAASQWTLATAAVLLIVALIGLV